MLLQRRSLRRRDLLNFEFKTDNEMILIRAKRTPIYFYETSVLILYIIIIIRRRWRRRWRCKGRVLREGGWVNTHPFPPTVTVPSRHRCTVLHSLNERNYIIKLYFRSLLLLYSPSPNQRNPIKLTCILYNIKALQT